VTYADSVLDCADDNGNLEPVDLLRLLAVHGATAAEWNHSPEAAKFGPYSAEGALSFLGY
jgi:hypothetical protein